MLHSIYDLTTYCRKTTGDVPPKLVGASTTVVGSKMYLFGGRLVTERKMVDDLYVFDLASFVWEKIYIHSEDDVPQARYFHSADTWDNKLIIFGGMSNQPDSINPDELCVLNDVRFFDISAGHWLPSLPLSSTPDVFSPRARYAHLSSVTADRLFVIGGQDFNNTWLDDVCVYDLVGKAWVQRRDYPRHCGTYRSVAVSSNTVVRLPQEEIRDYHPSSPFAPLGPNKAVIEPTSTESLIHIPYSAPPSYDYPSSIYLYSNYNFTDVKRELEVFSPLPDTGFEIYDKSSDMTGTTFPPGLRFPTGAILGTHLIIAGTYLAHSYQSFSIWVLDLLTMTWSRIDPGKAVESGSWFRGCLWEESNKFLIFGNKYGNLVDDYNRRLLSWDHVAVVDLEAFGIYQPPPLKLDITMQELGLAALEEGIVADFEIVCDDNRKLGCSRRVLEERWPWFREQRKKFMANAKQTADALPSSAMNVALPELPGVVQDQDSRLDPRLTSRSFHLSEPYPITLALLQYFYTLALVTPLQHAPAVLSQLLVLATNCHIQHLETLVKHAMHRSLSNSTSVGVYEVATLCSCRSLQIRALKTVMSYTQKRPPRSRGDGSTGGGKPPGGANGGGNGGGGDSSGNESQYISRPRGTSDARWRTKNDSTSSNGYITRTAAVPIDSTEDDQITPLPILCRAKLPRRSHAQSLVSFYADGDIHALANFISSFTSVNSSRAEGERFDDDPSLLTTCRHEVISSRNCNSPTSSSSESDYRYSYLHQSPIGLIQYPTLVSTASILSSTPSLTSASTSHYTSPGPITPLASSAELPLFSDLAVIDERHLDDEPTSAEHERDDLSPITFRAKEQLPHAWPRQKSEIQWIVSESSAPPEHTHVVSPDHAVLGPPIDTPRVPFISSRKPRTLLKFPQSPTTSRTPASTTFVRFFKKGGEDNERYEGKRRKEDAKAKKKNILRNVEI